MLVDFMLKRATGGDNGLGLASIDLHPQPPEDGKRPSEVTHGRFKLRIRFKLPFEMRVISIQGSMILAPSIVQPHIQSFTEERCENRP